MSEAAPSAPASAPVGRWWLWLAGALAVLKLALLRAQPIYAIGDAVHDDQLFLKLARSIADGQWLGAYDQLTLAKGAVYPAFVAANHYLGLPLRLTEQLLYVGACALVVRALLPVLRSGWARLLVFAVLLWNPLTFEGEHMTRILRQHLTAPLALTIAAALAALVLRRERGFRARLPWALTAGLAFGLFWNTREEGLWIVPLTALLGLAAALPLLTGTGAARLATAGLALVAGLAGWAPTLVISELNARHYGWFGTNEFHSAEFQAAYGALARVQVGPVRPRVVVSREVREAVYAVSPAFAELRPHLEGEIGLRWANGEDFRREERQIGSGWFMWALRDAVAAAGHARSAGDAIAFYARIADEVNRACESGKLPALARRDGYFPRWQPAYTEAVWRGAPQYIAAMLDFSRFEPNPPYSVGTDDEVRLFRDLTHDRISPSPKATFIELPASRELDGAKLRVLREIGRTIGPWLAAFLALAHVAAFGRLIQLVRARRATTTAWLAFAVWCGAAGELAVNILVHTTSMPNFYPAAYAPAFPLLILFALLVTLDVAADWRAPLARGWGWLRKALGRRAVASWAVAIGLVVFALRLREIALHAGDVPFLDQWRIEALEIITPWLKGELGLAAFFAPHHEHLPLWTRLLAWLQVAGFGTWDPRVQMVFNAAVHATWAGLLAGWLRTHFSHGAAWLLGLLLVAVAGLPHAWENMTWGFQSQFPLALLALFLFVREALFNPVGSPRWWGAQVIGFAGLFTLGSFWVAPLLLFAVNLWTAPRAWRRWLAPLGLGVFGAIVLWLAIRVQPPVGALSLRATELREFLDVWFFALGWPAPLPGLAVLLYLPVFALALRLRGAAEASALDRALLVFGLWSAAQAAGLAFARGALGPDFVSRYGDLYALGAVANGAILLRLAGDARRWILPGLAWVAAVAWGLFVINTNGHTAYFHARSAERAAFRRAAVSDYLLKQDDSKLRSLEARQLIYPDPSTVLRQLDDPQFAALLPDSVRGGSFPGWAHLFAAQWLLLLGAGVGLAWMSAGQSTPRTATALARGGSPAGPLILVTATSAAALLLWPRPTAWNQEERWAQLLFPATPLREVAMHFDSSTTYPDDRLWGAAALSPESLRNMFRGTHVDGPGFTGRVVSDPFRLESPWLVVPFAGYPIAPGNGLALVIEGGPLGLLSTRLLCPIPVRRDLGFWVLDVSASQGKSARLELIDARTGEEGWLAVAPPQAFPDRKSAERLGAAWNAERTLAARRTLAALAVVGLLGLVGTALRRRS